MRPRALAAYKIFSPSGKTPRPSASSPQEMNPVSASRPGSSLVTGMMALDTKNHNVAGCGVI